MGSDNVLVTLKEWFYAPDGRTYRGIWGEFTQSVDCAFVGNVRINNTEILTIIPMPERPADRVQDWNYDKGTVYEFERPTAIYIASSQK